MLLKKTVKCLNLFDSSKYAVWTKNRLFQKKIRSIKNIGLNFYYELPIICWLFECNINKF